MFRLKVWWGLGVSAEVLVVAGAMVGGGDGFFNQPYLGWL